MSTDKWFVDYDLPNPLSEKELNELFKQVENGSKEAKDKIITHNIKLVLYEVANKFKDVDYDKNDLVSIGNLGLMKAVNTYNLSKGVRFTTYATKCIHNEILLFLRKLKRDSIIDSLDKAVFYDINGKELKIEDKLTDDRDFVEDILDTETYKIIREMVNDLPKRDKEIIMLYFGFYNDQIYTQSQIAKKLCISRPYVSILINKIVKKIGKKLESNGVVEVHSSRKESVEKMPKLQSIYEYFKNYTRQQVDEMLMKLKDEEKALITIRYGEDLNNPVATKLNKEQINKFYGTLLPKMKRLLSNQTGERKLQKTKVEEQQSTKSTPSNNKVMTKEDCKKVLELLRTPSFGQMMSTLSVKQAVIIALKLGYIDGKYFSTEAISEFLGIEQSEVNETTREVLSVYKANINNFLDSAIAIATDKKGKGKVLDIKNPETNIDI